MFKSHVIGGELIGINKAQIATEKFLIKVTNTALPYLGITAKTTLRVLLFKNIPKNVTMCLR